jgi:hypothetical protein
LVTLVWIHTFQFVVSQLSTGVLLIAAHRTTLNHSQSASYVRPEAILTAAKISSTS